MKVITCIRCGAQKRTQDKNVGKYCSRTCQEAAVVWVEFQCLGCDQIVTIRQSQHRGQSYCSRSCRAAHKLRERQRICKTCGRQFMPSGRGKLAQSRQFCSTDCRYKTTGSVNYLDGRSLHPEYGRWSNMIARCTKPHHPEWKNYGGRGIIVCNEWLLDPFIFYEALADLGSRPEGYSLDRIDNNGNYEPGNIRWASRSEQRSNSVR